MPELKFRSTCQASAPGSWKWELYIEGDEVAVAVGFCVGGEADVDAAILQAEQFVRDDLGNVSGRPR